MASSNRRVEMAALADVLAGNGDARRATAQRSRFVDQADGSRDRSREAPRTEDSEPPQRTLRALWLEARLPRRSPGRRDGSSRYVRRNRPGPGQIAVSPSSSQRAR